jgi:hypothetical protein
MSRPVGDSYTGPATVVSTRLGGPEDVERLDRARQALGLTRAEYIRAVLKSALDATERPAGGHVDQAVA